MKLALFKKSMGQAHKGFQSYFEFYNTKRPLQALKYCTPHQVYTGEANQQFNAGRMHFEGVV